MTSHENYLRHSLKMFCESKDLSDLRFISSDKGETFCHKFILVSLLPELKPVLCCSSCYQHQVTTIIIPEVSKKDLDMARDFLYMFGDVEPFRKVFGLNKELSENVSSDTSILIEKKENEYQN